MTVWSPYTHCGPSSAEFSCSPLSRVSLIVSLQIDISYLMHFVPFLFKFSQWVSPLLVSSSLPIFGLLFLPNESRFPCGFRCSRLGAFIRYAVLLRDDWSFGLGVGDFIDNLGRCHASTRVFNIELCFIHTLTIPRGLFGILQPILFIRGQNSVSTSTGIFGTSLLHEPFHPPPALL